MAKSSGETVVRLPFYARASLIIIGLFVFISMLALAKSIIVPLLFAVVISILLTFVVDFLEQRKVDRTLAISIALLIAIFVFAVLFVWIISQANLFIDALPEFNKKFTLLQKEFASWFSENFGVSARKTNDWIDTARKDLTTMSSERVGSTITMLGNAMIILILIPVYIFLILYYQPLIIDFMHRFVGDGHDKDVAAVLGQTKTLLKSYFGGLLIELIVVAILNAIGLIALGVQYAILIAILGAFLNTIPYIGGLITLGLSMLMAMLSNSDPVFALYAAAVFFIIQIIDNYFLIPKVVGSKIRINALVAIVAVIAGGAIWGIPGMFLALPITAILKVIFDRIEPLKPWGFLLGDTMPPMVRIKFRGRRKAAES